MSDNRQVELILKARLIYHDSKNKLYSIGKALLLEKELTDNACVNGIDSTIGNSSSAKSRMLE